MFSMTDLEKPLMSKYEVKRSLADCESENPLLVVIPKPGVQHVYLELQSLTLQEVPVSQGGCSLRVHQGAIYLRAVSRLTLYHPGNAHVKETSLENYCIKLFRRNFGNLTHWNAKQW